MQCTEGCEEAKEKVNRKLKFKNSKVNSNFWMFTIMCILLTFIPLAVNAALDGFLGAIFGPASGAINAAEMLKVAELANWLGTMFSFLKGAINVAKFAVKLVIVYIPLLWIAYMFFWNVLAKKIYGRKKARKITYIVLQSSCYVYLFFTMLLLCLLMIFVVTVPILAGILLAYIVFGCVVIVMGVKNMIQGGKDKMELWFSEAHTPNVKISIKVDEQLYSGKSKFQRIDVFESEEFGRFLTLDGYIMLTEKDEFIYHEMIAHVPMAVHPNVKNVLVIGAGDGGTIRELLRYDSIENIDMVEIDELVVQVCSQFLPKTASELSNEKVHIFYEDGVRFIRGKENEYDLIIVDSTDPFGPGEGLFTKEFYGSCYQALKEDGIMVNQHESPFYEADAQACKRAHKRIVDSFPISRVYQAHIPTYPSGHWLFGFASKKYHPVDDLRSEEWKELGIETKYYTPKLHQGAFCLPAYVENLLKSVEIIDSTAELIKP